MNQNKELEQEKKALKLHYEKCHKKYNDDEKDEKLLSRMRYWWHHDKTTNKDMFWEYFYKSSYVLIPKWEKHRTYLYSHIETDMSVYDFFLKTKQFLYIEKVSFYEKTIQEYKHFYDDKHKYFGNDKNVVFKNKCCASCLLFGMDEYGYGWNLLGKKNKKKSIQNPIRIYQTYLCLEILKKKENIIFWINCERSYSVKEFLSCYDLLWSKNYFFPHVMQIYEEFKKKKNKYQRIIELEIEYPNSFLFFYFFYHYQEIKDQLIKTREENKKDSCNKKTLLENYNDVFFVRFINFLPFSDIKREKDDNDTTLKDGMKDGMKEKKKKEIYRYLLKKIIEKEEVQNETEKKKYEQWLISQDIDYFSCCILEKWMDYFEEYHLSKIIYKFLFSLTKDCFGFSNNFQKKNLENYFFKKDTLFYRCFLENMKILEIYDGSSNSSRVVMKKNKNENDINWHKNVWLQNILLWKSLFPLNKFDISCLKALFQIIDVWIIIEKNKKEKLLETLEKMTIEKDDKKRDDVCRYLFIQEKNYYKKKKKSWIRILQEGLHPFLIDYFQKKCELQSMNVFLTMFYYMKKIIKRDDFFLHDDEFDDGVDISHPYWRKLFIFFSTYSSTPCFQ